MGDILDRRRAYSPSEVKRCELTGKEKRRPVIRGRPLQNGFLASTAGAAPPDVVLDGWATTCLGHRIKLLVGQVDGGSGDNPHRGCSTDILVALPVGASGDMALRNALVGLVAGIIEPERIGVIRLPLHDVARIGGRNFANFA